MKAVWITVALLGLWADAAAAPIGPESRPERGMFDIGPDALDHIATDLDLPLFLIEEPSFVGNPGENLPAVPESDLSDDLPNSDILAKTLSGDMYLRAPALGAPDLRAPEPPTGVTAITGFAFLGIFEMLRRMLRFGAKQKKPGGRRRVRIYLRKMS